MMLTKFKTREEWMQARRTMITASDVAAILGWGAHQTALDVYVSKMTGQQIDDNDAMLLGRALEDGIAQVYGGKTGRGIVDPNPCIAVHNSLPWLAATPDRLVFDNAEIDFSKPPETGNPLEIKHAGWHQRRDWEDGAPLWVQIQLQIQVACLGEPWGAFCGVVGGSEIHYGDLDFDQAFFESALPVLDEFKWRLDHQKPPAVDSPKHIKAMKLLYPNDNGETVELSDDIQKACDRLEQAKITLKELDSEKDELEARIRESIGTATFGRLPDGTIMSLKTTARKGYTSIVKPTTYRTLRRVK